MSDEQWKMEIKIEDLDVRMIGEILPPVKEEPADEVPPPIGNILYPHIVPCGKYPTPPPKSCREKYQGTDSYGIIVKPISLSRGCHGARQDMDLKQPTKTDSFPMKGWHHNHPKEDAESAKFLKKQAKMAKKKNQKNQKKRHGSKKSKKLSHVEQREKTREQELEQKRIEQEELEEQIRQDRIDQERAESGMTGGWEPDGRYTASDLEDVDFYPSIPRGRFINYFERSMDRRENNTRYQYRNSSTPT